LTASEFGAIALNGSSTFLKTTSGLMKIQHRWLLGVSTMVLIGVTVSQGQAATVNFAGAQYDLPGGGLAGATSPPYLQAGWRTSNTNNVYAVGDSFPEQYYGQAGWALFASTFSYPNASANPTNANVPIAGDSTYQNLYDLPSWVTGSQIHATRLAGGGVYALIDDPQLMFGERWWSFDGVNYPPPTPANNTGQNPYRQIGFIVGNATTLDPNGNPDRWSFTVGDDVPSEFRIGVMNDGLNDANFASNFILMRKLGDDASLVSSGTLTNRNRLVDMVFFDIEDAQPGDTYVISASASNSRIGGISFDVPVPEPTTVAMLTLALGMVGLVRLRSK
jgi:hypothetical protein